MYSHAINAVDCNVQRCLVTGASGFIGNVLCQRLQTEKLFVRALVRYPSLGPWQESTAVDLNDDTQTHLTSAIVNNIDTIFHLAGIAHTGKSQGISAKQYWTVNVEATQKLLFLAAEAKVKRFIYFSSVNAIGLAADDYSLSKQAAEKLILEYGKKYGLHVCILQPSLVYGPHVKGNLQSMLRGIDQGWFPPLPETHNQRSMVSVQDTIDAAWMVANAPKANGKKYVLTDGQRYSTRQMYDAIRAAFGRPPKKWFWPSVCLRGIAKIADGIQILKKSHLPFNSERLEKLLGSAVYSSEAIQTELNWMPTMDFYRALPDMVSAYKKGKYVSLR